MPFLLENIIRTVEWLIAIALTLTAVFILAALLRRWLRNRYFRVFDRAKKQSLVLFQPVYMGEETVDTACREVRQFSSRPAREALEQYLLTRVETPEVLDVTRAVALKLGWIDAWIKVLRCGVGKISDSGQRVAALLKELGDDYVSPSPLRRLWLRLWNPYIMRCRAAERLTILPTARGLHALVAGTQDPHAEVQEVCVRNLARLRDTATLPVLVAEMIDVLEGKSPLSIRVLKSALVRFPLTEADSLLEALEHPNRRVRFFATDTIREMADAQAAVESVTKADFSPALYRLLTEKLARDEAADVRGRTALIVRYFNDEASHAILKHLLKDETWFVRMHACRACGHKFGVDLAPFVAECMTDSNWLVREAAVRSLREMGTSGADETLRVFISIDDRYGAEQIAEEIQRGGMIIEMLGHIDSTHARERIQQVARKMLLLGKTIMLRNYLVSQVPSSLKLLLIPEMLGYPQCLEALAACAESDPDEQVRAAAAAALSTFHTATQAGGSA